MNLTSNDKLRIWDTCPACVRKHAAAALALIPADPRLQKMDAHLVLLGRALILLSEAQTGYTGNAALASGCLSAVETLERDPALKKDLREIRLAADRGEFARASDLLISYYHPDSGVMVGANVAEAIRELRMEVLREFPKLVEMFDENGGFAYHPAELVPLLEDLVAYIDVTYVHPTEAT